jgi:2,3-bisphosphoglycerate-independent phosphoglycerate mutase
VLLAADNCRPDGLKAFSEKQALQGGLGHFPGVQLMALAMAHADRLGKYGA